MTRFHRGCGAAIVAAALLGLHGHAAAQTSVGTITACYYSAECTYTAQDGFSGVVDGPAFQFTNTSDQAITGAKFTIAGSSKLGITTDSFKIGTIAAGASFVLVVGASNDGKKRSSTSDFFYFFGASSPRDTSDDGPDADAIRFSFTGKLGASKVASGSILTGRTAGPSADGSVAKLNFLGGPGNADGPCNDCFAPKTIATISITGGASVPGIGEGLAH